MDKSECKITKVLTVKTTRSTYYVQRQPGWCGLGVRYAVMKDRKKLLDSLYDSPTTAIEMLLDIIRRDLINQKSLFD